MKRFNIILFALIFSSLFCCFIAKAQPQGITLNMERVTVKKVIETITEQYNYSFVYESHDVDTKKIITVKLNNATIEDAVNVVLQGQSVSFEIKGHNIVLSKKDVPKSSNPSVKIEVKGVIVDTYGEPVIGASIIEKGSSANGTTSDIDGRFAIRTSVGSVISVLFIGYSTQDIKIENQNDIKVVLEEDVLYVEEVVVVGYGSQKKENLTGAVATISSKAIENRSVTSISQAL